jgi:large subunit ribosomal protein L6
MFALQNYSFNIQILDYTKILFYNNFIIVNGPRGVVSYTMFNIQKKYTITLKRSLIMAVVKTKFNIKNGNRLLKLHNLLKNLMLGVNFFFSKKLFLIGVGIRSWTKKLKHDKRILIIKGGYSEDIFIVVPTNITVFCLRPTLLLIRGLNKEIVSQFTNFVRLHKKPDKFRGVGFQYKNEALFLKAGKKN